MSTPALITQEDLEERYPPQFVRQVFADNGALTPGPRLPVACVVATRLGESILLKAWTSATIPTLVAEDEAVKSQLCAIAMFEGMQGKPQWCGQGAPYATLRSDAMKVLDLLAMGQLRSSAEAKAGANPNRKGNIASPDCPPRMFAPTRDRPKPGGY